SSHSPPTSLLSCLIASDPPRPGPKRRGGKPRRRSWPIAAAVRPHQSDRRCDGSSGSITVTITHTAHGLYARRPAGHRAKLQLDVGAQADGVRERLLLNRCLAG